MNFLHSCCEVFVFHVFQAELFLVVILSFSFAVSSSHLLWLQITFREKVIDIGRKRKTHKKWCRFVTDSKQLSWQKFGCLTFKCAQFQQSNNKCFVSGTIIIKCKIIQVNFFHSPQLQDFFSKYNTFSVICFEELFKTFCSLQILSLTPWLWGESYERFTESRRDTNSPM